MLRREPPHLVVLAVAGAARLWFLARSSSAVSISENKNLEKPVLQEIERELAAALADQLSRGKCSPEQD